MKDTEIQAHYCHDVALYRRLYSGEEMLLCRVCSDSQYLEEVEYDGRRRITIAPGVTCDQCGFMNPYPRK